MTDRYVELHAASAFSFLQAASQPESLIERAVEVQMPAMALLDHNGVYGSARFHTSAQRNNILIGMGAIVMVSAVTERKQQTLPFVMSLPISYWEYTTAKIVGTLLIFLVLWTAMLADMLATILLTRGVPHGLIPFVVIMSVEILMSTCLVTAVAVTTESQGWAVGSAQVGALSLNGIGWWIVRFPNIGGTMRSATMQWSGTATALVTAELAAIALMIATTFFVQSRKKDFI